MRYKQVIPAAGLIRSHFISSLALIVRTRMHPGLLLWLLMGALLVGCDRGASPDSRRELAVQGLYSAALSQQGDLSLVGSIHHGGSLWGNQKNERLFDWNHKAEGYSSILSTAIAADGKYGVTADKRNIVIWEVATGDAVWFWKAPADVEAIALADGGSIAAVGMRDYTVTLFDSKNGGLLRIFRHEGDVQSVDISAQGEKVLSGSDDSTARVWDVRQNKEINQVKHDNQVMTVTLGPNAKLAFSSSYRGNSWIWEVATGKVIQELPQPSGYYRSARFSKSGDQLLTGTSAGHIQLWSVSSGDELGIWTATPKDRWVASSTQVLAVGFAAGGYLAIGANGYLYSLSQ
jgi:WD40 repeat protein